eukprot:8437525-Karenia_brevis.AAC.1
MGHGVPGSVMFSLCLDEKQTLKVGWQGVDVPENEKQNSEVEWMGRDAPGSMKAPALKGAGSEVEPQAQAEQVGPHRGSFLEVS